MKRDKRLYYFLMLLLASLTITGCTLRRSNSAAGDISPLAAPVSAQTEAQVTALVQVRPTAQQIDPGGRAVIEVWAENVTDLMAVELQLRFNPSVLQAVDADPDREGIQIQPGSLLAANFEARNEVDNNTGTIQYVLTQLAPTPPVTGQGVLARITFEGIAQGTSTVNIALALLVRGNAETLPVITSDGEVTVGPGGGVSTATPTPTATLMPGEATATATTPPGTTPVIISPTPTLAPVNPTIIAPDPTLLPPTPTFTATPLPLPTLTPSPTSTPVMIAQPVHIPPDATFGFCYRSQPGEDIHVLAKKFQVSPQAINLANDLNPPFYIKAQKTLFIPKYMGTGPNVYEVQPGDTLDIIAERCKLPVEMLARVNNIQPSDPLYAPAGTSVRLTDGSTVVVTDNTLLVQFLIIPIPPFPPPSRYQYPSGPIPIVPYSKPYPIHK